MGWQDAPVVDEQPTVRTPAWMQAPLVDETSSFAPNPADTPAAVVPGNPILADESGSSSGRAAKSNAEDTLLSVMQAEANKRGAAGMYGKRKPADYAEYAASVARHMGIESNPQLVESLKPTLDAFDLLHEEEVGSKTPAELRNAVLAATQYASREQDERTKPGWLMRAVGMGIGGLAQAGHAVEWLNPWQPEDQWKFEGQLLQAATGPERFVHPDQGWVSRNVQSAIASIPKFGAAALAGGPAGVGLMFGVPRAVETAEYAKERGANRFGALAAGVASGALETALFSQLPSRIIGQLGGKQAAKEALGGAWEAVKRYGVETAKTGTLMTLADAQGRMAEQLAIRLGGGDDPDALARSWETVKAIPDTFFQAAIFHAPKGAVEIAGHVRSPRPSLELNREQWNERRAKSGLNPLPDPRLAALPDDASRSQFAKAAGVDRKNVPPADQRTAMIKAAREELTAEQRWQASDAKTREGWLGSPGEQETAKGGSTIATWDWNELSVEEKRRVQQASGAPEIVNAPETSPEEPFPGVGFREPQDPASFQVGDAIRLAGTNEEGEIVKITWPTRSRGVKNTGPGVTIRIGDETMTVSSDKVWNTDLFNREQQLEKERLNAQQVSETGPNDGSGGPRQVVREEGGNPAEGGPGVQPSGQVPGQEAQEVTSRPKGIPPLKPGFVRVVHIGRPGQEESFCGGLDYSRQGMIQSTARAYSNEADVEYRHDDPRFANGTAYVYDVPEAEMRQHTIVQSAPGKISGEYYVGSVPPSATETSVEGQEISDGAVLPPGMEIRENPETGKNEARRPGGQAGDGPSAEEAMSPEESTPSAETAAPEKSRESDPGLKGEPADAGVPARITSIKKAMVNDLRAGRGEPPIPGATPETVEQWANEAETKFLADPEVGAKLVASLAAHPRSIDEREAMVVQMHYRDTYNRLGDAVQQKEAASAARDAVAEADAEAAIDAAGVQLHAIEAALAAPKTKWGRTGVAIKMGLAEDYTIVGLTHRFMAAKGHHPNAAEAVELKRISDDHAAAEAGREAAASRSLTKDAYDRFKKESPSSRKGVRAGRKAAADKEIADGWKKLNAALLGRTHPTAPAMVPPKEALDAIGQIVKGYAKKGLFAIEDVIDAFRMRIGDRVDEFRPWIASEWEKAKPKAPKGADSDMRVLGDYARWVARRVVGAGAPDAESMVQLVLREMRESVPATTRQQAVDAILGRGEFRPHSGQKAKTRLQQLKAELRALTADEHKLRTQEKALDRSIASLQKDINEGVLWRGKPETVTPEFLAAKRGQLDDLKQERQALRDSADPNRDYRESLQRQVDEYERRTEEGDFSRKAPKVRKLSPEEKEWLRKRDDARERFRAARDKAERERMSKVMRAISSIPSTLNLMKAIKATWDNSMIGRQGFVAGVMHPIIGIKSATDGFVSFFSKNNHLGAMEELKTHPDYNLAIEAGLHLVDENGPVEHQVEQFSGALMKKIPGVAGSERAAVRTLNGLRMSVFSTLCRTWSRTGEPTPGEAQVYANAVNVFTAKGRLTTTEKSAQPFLRPLIWTYGMIKSRLQFLYLQPLWHGLMTDGMGWKETKRARMAIAAEYARLGLGMTALIGLANAVGAAFSDDDEPSGVNLDPGSSDFLHLRWGQYAVDLSGGIAQYVRLGYHLTKGERTTQHGQIQELSGADKAERIGKMIRYKLTPSAGLLYDVFISGEHPGGDKVTPLSVLNQAIVPLNLGDVAKALWTDTNMPRGAAMAIASTIGLSVKNYEHTTTGSKKADQVFEAWFAAHPRDDTLFPGAPKREYTRNGRKVEMTDEQYAEFRTLAEERTRLALTEQADKGGLDPKHPTREMVKWISRTTSRIREITRKQLIAKWSGNDSYANK